MDSQPETKSEMFFDGREVLGNRLLTARKSLGLSRDAVIEQSTSGFSRSTLQAWEAGEREPGFKNLFDLARIYGVHPWDLIYPSHSETGTTATESNLPTDGFGERIEWVINELGGPGQAAQKIGTTYTTLKRWRTNEADPSRINIIRIADAANIDINWLVTGEGSPTKALKEPDSLSHMVDEYVYVPGYGIEVSAGYGMFSDGAIKPDRYLAFRKRWAKARGLDAKYLVVLFARGDSMEPTIINGAAIVVNLLKNHAMDGKIYVVRISDRLWVKRIQWTPDGGLRLISDNKEVYDPFDIARQDLKHMDIEIIGEVIHTSYDLPD